MEIKKKRPMALVTGASAGIGEALAVELARRGHDLILSARRQDRLQELAARLEREHGSRCLVLTADLAQTDASEQLERRVADAGWQVDVLINNAGYGVPGFYHTTDWPTQAAFLQVLINATAELSHRFLPGMRERGHGRIMHVASLAGLIPGSSGSTLYGGAKSFAIRFAQSLALENRDRDIQVCALCPGFTYSEFHDVTGARPIVSRLPRWMWMSAEEVARDGLDALERGDVVRVSGWRNRMIARAFKLMPERLALHLIARQSGTFREQGEVKR